MYGLLGHQASILIQTYLRLLAAIAASISNNGGSKPTASDSLIVKIFEELERSVVPVLDEGAPWSLLELCTHHIA